MHNCYTLSKNVQAKHVCTCPFEIYVYIHVCGGGMGVCVGGGSVFGGCGSVGGGSVGGVTVYV